MLKKLISAFLGAFFISGAAIAADCARTTGPYSDGDILYAASYDGEENNQITCINNRVQDTGDTMTGALIMSGADIKINAGSSLKLYADAATTIKALLDGTTGQLIAGITRAGQSVNCDMSVSGSTFTISGWGGTALSATYPCVVGLKSNTGGKTALAFFTSNITFTFGSTSDTDGNDFGVTNTANWALVMPFFSGIIYNGSNAYFTIMRLPLPNSGAASASVCQKGDTDCDAEEDVMILTTGLTLSGWTSLPITQVGWFEMTYATSGNAWTATTPINTGFNDDYEKIDFTFPSGQMGAAAASYTVANGGTPPLWTLEQPLYTIEHTGYVTYRLRQNGDNGTDGATAVTAIWALPYTAADTQQDFVLGNAYITNVTYTNNIGTVALSTGSGSSAWVYRGGAAVLWSDFANGARTYSMTLRYKTFP